MILSIILPIILLIVILILFWIIWPIFIGAIYLPTPHKTVSKMLELVELGDNDVLYDLGSGDGRIIIEAAEKYNSKSIGIEADPLRVLWTRMKIMSNKERDKIKVIWGNFFKTDLSKATVITVYQGQGINRKLIDKFVKELDPDTRIVSYSFTFDSWEPIKKDTNSQIYVYKIPTKQKNL